MLHIALCDDDVETLVTIKKRVLDYFSGTPQGANVKAFSQGDRLMESVSDGDRFDLYLLKVEMPEADGFVVARKIRVYQPNAGIIFLASHLEFADEGYKIHALRYVQKLKLEQALPEALCEAVSVLERMDEHSLLVPHYGNLTRILYRDIIYVKKASRSLDIVTALQGTVHDHRGLKELYEQINDSRFVFAERSCFVNLDFAQQIDGSWIVLKGGGRLPVSGPMMPGVKDAVIRLYEG